MAIKQIHPMKLLTTTYKLITALAITFIAQTLGTLGITGHLLDISDLDFIQWTLMIIVYTFIIFSIIFSIYTENSFTLTTSEIYKLQHKHEMEEAVQYLNTLEKVIAACPSMSEDYLTSPLREQVTNFKNKVNA